MSNSNWKHEAISSQIPELLAMLGLERHSQLMRAVSYGRLGFKEAREIIHDALSWRSTLRGNGGLPPVAKETFHSWRPSKSAHTISQILKDSVDPEVVSNHLDAGWKALELIEDAFRDSHLSEFSLRRAAPWVIKCARDVEAHAVAANQRAEQLNAQWKRMAETVGG